MSLYQNDLNHPGFEVWARKSLLKTENHLCGATDLSQGRRRMEAKIERPELMSPIKCEHGRRGRQDIIMGILRVATHGSKKTNMIDKVKLSSAQCTKYLEDLKEAGYISEEGAVWRTTEKGLQVIDACVIWYSLMNMR